MIINDGHDDNPTLEESTPRFPALSTYRGIDWSLCRAVLKKYMWQGSKKMKKLREPYHIFEGALPHIWGSLTTYLRESYHIFEGGVEVFDILRTFCLRCKSIIHVEENHTTGFGHVAERNMFQGYVEMRLSWRIFKKVFVATAFPFHPYIHHSYHHHLHHYDGDENLHHPKNWSARPAMTPPPWTYTTAALEKFILHCCACSSQERKPS